MILSSKYAKLLIMPKLFCKGRCGFSLIELLVAISIIAILATIGFSVFQSAQGKSKDARRVSDVDAISKAYENKYDPLKAEYQSITDADFTSGKIPTPPEGGSYIFWSGPNSPQVFCPENNTRFKVCARMSDTSATSSCNGDTTCYCRTSSQNYSTTCTLPPPPPDAGG